MTNKKRIFTNAATRGSGKNIIPLLHEWLYPQEGKGSSLNLNQDLLIHMSTCDPGYHIPYLHIQYEETTFLGEHLILTSV